jgi:hypothetical protein
MTIIWLCFLSQQVIQGEAWAASYDSSIGMVRF